MASTKRSALATNAIVDTTALHQYNTTNFVEYASFEQQATKLQAASNKRQAPSDSSNKQQASSSEQQASSAKPRAASSSIL
jgi:hypothetical protein